MTKKTASNTVNSCYGKDIEPADDTGLKVLLHRKNEEYDDQHKKKQYGY